MTPATEGTDSRASGASPDLASPASMSDRKGLVLVPTYNERESIEALIAKILAQPARLEVLVIDDGSPDGTADLVRALAAKDPRIRLMERAGKLGLGSAYVAGFRYALAETDAELIFQMDADFSHDPAAIGEFLAAASEADLVIGSRYLKGVTVVNWPLKRLFLSYSANVYTRWITGLPVKDATGGYKCFRREVLEAIDWDRIHSDGYSFQIETTFHAWRGGFRIREIPILFVDRRVGISKMNRRIVCEAIFVVWRLGFQAMFRRRGRPDSALETASRKDAG